MAVQSESISWHKPDKFAAAEDDQSARICGQEEEVNAATNLLEVATERALGLLELLRLLEMKLADEEPDYAGTREADRRA